MKKFLLVVMITVIWSAVAFAESVTVPDETSGLRVTGETIGTDRPMHVYDLSGTSFSTTTQQIVVNTDPLDNLIVVSFSVAAGATGTYTLPAAAVNGNYEFRTTATGETYFNEDSTTRFLLKSGEYNFQCEGYVCGLPSTLNFFNDLLVPEIIYLKIRYQ